MKIIIIVLLCFVIMLSGCVTNTDYTGTYVGQKETVTLFSDGTFSIQDEGQGFSGTYEIMDDKIYFKHPLMSMSFHINETGIYNGVKPGLIKQ